ncbi:hypothetical protein AB1N83_003866 [Pleurotus pulmonarius]
MGWRRHVAYKPTISDSADLFNGDKSCKLPLFTPVGKFLLCCHIERIGDGVAVKRWSATAETVLSASHIRLTTIHARPPAHKGFSTISHLRPAQLPTLVMGAELRNESGTNKSKDSSESSRISPSMNHDSPCTTKRY